MTVKLQHPIKKEVTREIFTNGFNMGGLILGPLLYIGWGMWQKGLFLLLIMVVLAIFQELLIGPSTTSILPLLVSFYCAFSLYKDNYNHLLKKGWKQLQK